HVISGREVRHLPGNARLEHRGIEAGNTANRRSPLEQPLPEPLDAETDRRDRADAGDDDPPQIHEDLLPPSSTYLAIPLKVLLAMPWIKTGPITRLAAVVPTMGQDGPPHSCTMLTSVLSAEGSSCHTTSIPA